MILTKKPSVFICGHIHEAYGFEKLENTMVVNCACSYYENRGIVIDTETKICLEIML